MNNFIKVFAAAALCAATAGAMDINGDIGAYLKESGNIKAAAADWQPARQQPIVITGKSAPGVSEYDYGKRSMVFDMGYKSKQEALDAMHFWMKTLEAAGLKSTGQAYKLYGDYRYEIITSPGVEADTVERALDSQEAAEAVLQLRVKEHEIRNDLVIAQVIALKDNFYWVTVIFKSAAE